MSRMEKVNQQLKREIGQIMLQELADPRVEFVSIIRVDTSKDLRSARVYYSVLGGKHTKENVQAGLDGASGIIRRLIGQRLALRYTPEFKFFFDDSIEFSSRMDETINDFLKEKDDDAEYN